jgi:fatty-acyl-CoA synthase
LKLCVSTLCCPEMDFFELCAVAKDIGYSGIEIRKLGNESYAPKMYPFIARKLDSTIEKLKRISIDIPLLSSKAVIGVRGKDEDSLKEIKDYIDLARLTGSKYIRIFGGKSPQGGEFDEKLALEQISKISNLLKGTDVEVLIETNGVFNDSDYMAEFLKKCGEGSFGALWDINYPYRYNDETPAKTAEALKEWIRFAHIKDSKESEYGTEFCLMGEGTLPIDESLQALLKIGFNGFLSFEWSLKWSGELVDPGIVISHYASFMQRKMKKLGI